MDGDGLCLCKKNNTSGPFIDLVHLAMPLLGRILFWVRIQELTVALVGFILDRTTLSLLQFLKLVPTLQVECCVVEDCKHWTENEK